MERQSVVVNSRKYDGEIRRTWTCELVANDDGLIILEGVFERDVSHPQLGNIERGTRSVEYFWPNRWYNIFKFHTPQGDLRNWYCNVNMPPSFINGTLDYVDLDIDIVVWPDMSFAILDRDEFEENAQTFTYPLEISQNVEKAVAELLSMIENRRFPFDPA
ncbi:MAG TPA: DUF402 domain-containing protein [Pyrinomonadaceae bacterium]|nr:DUF402 domain-containing protein [Pyrinomonadaceae bacterium]HMP64884.1 DUF402 domain-containing protein [Pyrinomonadaceae bacterium]